MKKIFGLFFCLIILAQLTLLAIAAEIPLEKLIPKYTDQTSKFIEVDGVKFHVREKGQGPTIVLLHGILSSLHTWDEWMPGLEKFRVIRIDLPGHGLTGPDPRQEYSIERMIALLNKLYKKLNIKKAHLVGNSLGGWISWEFAVKHPKRVDKLVLIDSAGFNIHDVPWIVSFAQLPIAPHVLAGNAPRLAVRFLVNSVYGDPLKVTEDTVTRYHDMFLREGNGGAFMNLVRTPLEDHAHLLNDLKMPVLILWGERDQWISPKYAPEFHATIAGSKLITYPELGHVPMEEAPARTLKDVLTFLESRK